MSSSPLTRGISPATVAVALADITLYGVVMSLIGRVELAVTTNMTVHFLSRPPPRDVLAEGRILKLGRRLAVGQEAHGTAWFIDHCPQLAKRPAQGAARIVRHLPE